MRVHGHGTLLHLDHQEVYQHGLLRYRLQGLIVLALEVSTLVKAIFNLRSLVFLFSLPLIGHHSSFHLWKRCGFQSLRGLHTIDDVFCPLSKREASLLPVAQIHTYVEMVENLPVCLNSSRKSFS